MVMTVGTMNSYLVKTAPVKLSEQIQDRELFFDSTEKKLYVYYGKYYSCSANVDNFNIVLNDKDEVALNKDVFVKETVCNLSVSNQCIIFTTGMQNIIIFSEYNKGLNNNIHFGGLITFTCENSKGMYELDFVNSGPDGRRVGSIFIRGTSSNEHKARPVCVTIGNQNWLGLKVYSDEVHDVHIHGFGPLVDAKNFYEVIRNASGLSILEF